MYGLTHTAADQFKEILVSMEKEAKETCPDTRKPRRGPGLGPGAGRPLGTGQGLGLGPGKGVGRRAEKSETSDGKPKTAEWTGVPEIISGQKGKITTCPHGDVQIGNPSGAVDRILAKKISISDLNKDLDEVPGEVRTQNPVIRQDGKNLPAITSGGDKAEKVASFQKKIAKLASQGTLRTYGVTKEGEVKLAASPFPHGESAEKKDSKKAPFKMTPKAWKTLAAAVGIPLGVAAIGIAAGHRASKQSFKNPFKSNGGFGFDAGKTVRDGMRAGARRSTGSSAGRKATEDPFADFNKEWERARKEAEEARQQYHAARQATQKAQQARRSNTYKDPFSYSRHQQADFRYGAGSSKSSGTGAGAGSRTGQSQGNQGSTYRPPSQSDKKREAYEFFRVPQGTPVKDVSKIHKKWSLKWHPDRPGGNTAEQAKINEMFDRIKNSSLRIFENQIHKVASKGILRTYRYAGR